MLEIKFSRIMSDWQTKYKPVVRSRHSVCGENKEQCFYKIYDEYERSLRYMNGHYIRLDDEKLEKEYREWLKNNLTMELYYGGGVVD